MAAVQVPTERGIIGYIRKSPVGRKKSYGTGLGVAAQEAAIFRYAENCGGEVVKIYRESERGKNPNRPELRKAIAEAKKLGAVLIVARLDRMARNTRLFLELMEGGVDVGFCDFPQIPAGPAGRLMLTLLAAIAQFEAEMISERTKAALAEAKKRGVILGGANPACRNLTVAARERGVAARREAARMASEGLRDVLEPMRLQGLTLQAMCGRLNEEGRTAPRGGGWSATQVSRILTRLGI